MKILAVDPGSKRLGLAACDELQMTTRLLPVREISAPEGKIPFLVNLIRDEGFQKVVVGLPLNMDGSEGEAARRARQWGLNLEKELRDREISCGVEFWDERLTSFEAEQRVRESGIAKAKAKDFLDSVAAQVLLEDYLRTRGT